MKNYLLWLQKRLVLLLLFCSPLIFAPFFDYPFETGKIIIFYFIGAFLVLILGLRVSNEKVNITFPRIAFLFFFFNLVSFVFSWDKNISLWGKYGYYTDSLVFLFYCLVLFLSVASLKSTKNFVKKAVFVTALAILTISLIGLREYFLGVLKTGNRFYRISSTLGQPNRLAHFLLPANIFVLFSLPLFSKKIEKIFLATATLFGFTTFIITFSRSNYLILLLVILFVVLFQISKMSAKQVFFKKILFLFSILAVSFFLHKKFFIDFKSIFRKDPYNSPYLRLQEQLAAWQDWKNKNLLYKLVGTGPETLVYSYPQFKPLIINQNNNEWFQQTSKVRNQYLHYLNTIGIIGATIYFLIILHSSAFDKKLFSKNTFIQGVYFSFVTIAIGNFFYYQTIANAIYFWLFVGILSQTKSKNISVKISSFPIKIFLYLITSFLFILQLNFIGRFALADYLSHTNKIKNLQGSVRLSPYIAIYKRKLGQKHLTTALLFWEEKKIFLFDQEIKKAISWYKEAIILNPKDINNLRSLQWALYNAGSKLDKKYQEENLLLSQTMVELSPRDPLTYDGLGLVYLDLGKYEAALRSFKKTLEIKPDFVGSYLHIGETLKQMGRLDEAIIYYQKALGKKPGWLFAQQELKKAQDLLDK